MVRGPPYDLIFFDCDSTLSAIEGIDELARRAGQGPEIAALTRAAMDGGMALENVYGRRLDLIRPDRGAVEWLGGRYIETLVVGTGEVLAVLHALGKEVHIVSAGIRQAVLVLAAQLYLPPARVHAVELRFNAAGQYLGFDERSPLTRTGGKAEICRGLGAAVRRAALVGDGVSDLEAGAAGVCIIGFGGVVAREIMRRRADHFVAGPSFQDVLEPLLSPEERLRAGLGQTPFKSGRKDARGES